MMKFAISILLSVFGFTCLPQTALAKDWRGIVPLKTTQVEVERRFGKPDKRGGYEFGEERVSFYYGEGQCKGLYLSLGEDNCKCLADKNAVMSIFVEPTTKLKISDLKLDLKRFTRTPINPFPQTFEYANFAEGIVYTVDESENEVMHISYYPSVADCQDIITRRGPKNRNSWRGLIPLHSRKREVEVLLGRPEEPSSTTVVYKTDYESVVATYSNGKCATRSPEWNVPKDTLIELVVNPTPSFLLKELSLESSRYERKEIFPFPETGNPPRVWIYTDKANGVSIRTQSDSNREEVVVSVTYFPSQRDERFRCKLRNN